MGSLASQYSASSLLGASREYAREAIRDFEERRWSLLPLHAGASAEFLAKSALSEISPFLLVSGHSQKLTKSLATLSGAAGSGSAFTVDLRDGVDRLRALLPFEASQDDVERLQTARNAAVHIGGPTTDGVELLLSFFRVACALLAYTGSGRSGYWGRHTAAVKLAAGLDPGDALSGARVRVAFARGQARTSAEAALREARSLVATSERVHTFDEVAPCPVCKCSAGWRGDWGHSTDADAFVPAEVHCAGCNLWLRGRAELDLAMARECWESRRPDSQRALWNGGMVDGAPRRQRTAGKLPKG